MLRQIFQLEDHQPDVGAALGYGTKIDLVHVQFNVGDVEFIRTILR